MSRTLCAGALRGQHEHQARLREIRDVLNSTFANWLEDHYSSLINLPPTNPAMLHHVPRRLARDIEGSDSSRAALIVVDGLALDQWVTIRRLLQKQGANLVMRESATFAWIPTLTSVSRQAIFSGKPPLYFPSSINSTGSEEKLWKQFWEGHGLSRLEVAYQRGLGDLPAPLPHFFCYVLKCVDGSFYIGQTDDIARRLKEHRRKECSWTSSRLPVGLIHHEVFNRREEAVAREKELKTGYGRAWLKKLYAQGKLNADWSAPRQAGGDAAGVLDSAIHPGKTKVVGLVVDKVDKIMHGMQLGSAGMHNQIKQWCQGGFLAELAGQLLEYGYEVWLTADHGNIQCEGKGRPSEGVIAETRGERVRVYPTPELRAQVAGAFPFAHEWQPVGLPADYFPLVAGGRDAFVNPGDAIVGHGGVAIEEVIVPLVKFERRTR